ncbi:MAG: metalloregulator ArsR/SmtB family transcription factor [Candidatus Omnitrophota bacterium]
MGLERILKALADKNRIRIIKLLENRRMCVCQLAFVLGVTQPSVSRHLKKLCATGLVQGRQEGFWTYYCLGRPRGPGKTLLECVCRWLEDEDVVAKDRKKLTTKEFGKVCDKRD